MAARALASATIAFGMVAIPVKLFTSNESSATIRFNQLHGECGSRLKQQYNCPKCGPIERTDIVKGYEFAKDQYVTFSDEELKVIEAKASQSIEIQEFIESGQVDRAYVDKVYYLGPDKGGARPYHLLAEAMRHTGRCALAQYAARGKEYLVLLRPVEGGLVMDQLRYAEEVRPFDAIPIEEADIQEQELALAVQLVEQVGANDFDPSKYQDTVRARTLDLIDRKVDGEDITVIATEESDGKIIDMMDALKASLSEVSATARKPAKRAAKKAPARKKAAKRSA